MFSRLLRMSYSSYSPNFINPILKPADQKELPKAMRDLPIKAAKTNQITSEILYDENVEKFICYVMRHGDKELAKKLTTKTFETIKKILVGDYNRTGNINAPVLDPLTIFKMAYENCKPVVELITVKRGGRGYQVPVGITEKRSSFLSMKFLIESANDWKPKTKITTRDSKLRLTGVFYEQLARELIEASQNRGNAVKRKKDLHRQCEANRAYAHYRWT